jgi:hypothetical protein
MTLKPLPETVPDDYVGVIEFTPVIKQDKEGHWHLIVVVDAVDKNKIYESKRAAELECPLSFDTFEKGSEHYQTFTRPSMDATFERVRDRKGNLQIFLDEVTVDLQNIEALLAMPSPPEAS